MRLLDRHFSCIAQGVGTARILGRVHSAPLKLADLHLPCSFTIMEGRAVDLLFGLDMLKAHQACIDLEKNVLRIQGREVRFLAEHELPEKARDAEQPADAAATVETLAEVCSAAAAAAVAWRDVSSAIAAMLRAVLSSSVAAEATVRRISPTPPSKPPISRSTSARTARPDFGETWVSPSASPVTAQRARSRP